VELLRNRDETKNVSGDYLKSLDNKRTSSAIRVEKISAKSDLRRAFAIRIRVFVKEQGVPAEIELDRDDKRAIHFLATSAGRAVGTARIVMRQETAKIGRMAVLKSHRRKGVGTRLLRRAVATARRLGAEEIYLHAQVPVIGFYETIGFRCVGRIFYEAGIPHRTMILGGKGSSRKERKEGDRPVAPTRLRLLGNEDHRTGGRCGRADGFEGNGEGFHRQFTPCRFDV